AHDGVRLTVVLAGEEAQGRVPTPGHVEGPQEAVPGADQAGVGRATVLDEGRRAGPFEEGGDVRVLRALLHLLHVDEVRLESLVGRAHPAAGRVVLAGLEVVAGGV